MSVSDVQDTVTVQGRALDVEQCDCGPEYTGLSCEVWTTFGFTCKCTGSNS